jgi:hypothetical protein
MLRPIVACSSLERALAGRMFECRLAGNRMLPERENNWISKSFSISPSIVEKAKSSDDTPLLHTNLRLPRSFLKSFNSSAC